MSKLDYNRTKRNTDIIFLWLLLLTPVVLQCFGIKIPVIFYVFYCSWIIVMYMVFDISYRINGQFDLVSLAIIKLEHKIDNIERDLFVRAEIMKLENKTRKTENE